MLLGSSKSFGVEFVLDEDASSSHFWMKNEVCVEQDCKTEIVSCDPSELFFIKSSQLSVDSPRSDAHAEQEVNFRCIYSPDEGNPTFHTPPDPWPVDMDMSLLIALSGSGQANPGSYTDAQGSSHIEQGSFHCALEAHARLSWKLMPSEPHEYIGMPVHLNVWANYSISWSSSNVEVPHRSFIKNLSINGGLIEPRYCYLENGTYYFNRWFGPNPLHGEEITLKLGDSFTIEYEYDFYINGPTGWSWGYWEHPLAPTDLYICARVAPELEASFKYLPVEPMVGGKIEFDASDSQGNVVDYKWDFDDGPPESYSIPEVSHIFKEPGIYDVNLTVTDENGLTDSNEVKLDLSLKNGDLLLCRSEGSLVPGFWTHVGIYHQPSNMVVEARAHPDWVVSFYPLSDWFFDEITCAEVLRVVTDQPTRDAAVSFAKGKVGHAYDLYSIFTNQKQDGEDVSILGLDIMWYCSELVWAAYLSASNGQINLDPDNHTVSPDEINNSNHTEFRGAHMEDIPDTVGIRYFWGQADCPVDLEITDPDGLVLKKQGSQIPGGVYQEFDIDGDDDLDDFFAIPEPKEGNYLIHVIPEPGALPTDTFTLVVNRNGTARVLSQDVQVQDIPEAPYIVTDLVDISADVEIEPQSLNLSSEGKWITCYIELPEAYDESDIDVESILLEGLLEVQHSDVQDDILMVKFDRQDVITYIELVLEIELSDDVTLMVTGELTDGTSFEGIDTIRVIDEGGEE